MNRAIVALMVVAVAAVGAGNVSAAKPGSGQLTIAASKPQVTYSRSAVISGQLKRTPAGGQQVQLQQAPFPFNKFTDGPTATTDSAGNYSFTVTPTTSTHYRVVTVAKPKLTSAEAP